MQVCLVQTCIIQKTVGRQLYLFRSTVNTYYLYEFEFWARELKIHYLCYEMSTLKTHRVEFHTPAI